ncbi:MAG: hypothetical protein ACYSTX_04400 [Planctomycetota bacterium]|jgi:hypothetical protein
MLNSYGSMCDDFHVEMYVNTELDLPTQRDTILSFFERVQRHFPDMGCFYHGLDGEFCLEESRKSGQYRWLALEKNRIGSGMVNPINLEEAYKQDRLILELIPYMLSVSHLDFDSLDLTFGMDFEYLGNHDEVISEALFSTSAFSCFLEVTGVKAIGFSPVAVFSLSNDFNTQARMSIESKTNIYEPQKHRHRSDEAISLSFTIRQYPPGAGKFDSLNSFEHQTHLIKELMDEKVIPHFVQPLVDVITQKKLTN